MKSFPEFSSFIKEHIPDGYRTWISPHEKTIRIGKPWNSRSTNNYFVTIIQKRHDAFEIRSKHGARTVYSKLMLEQELLVLFTLARMDVI